MSNRSNLQFFSIEITSGVLVESEQRRIFQTCSIYACNAVRKNIITLSEDQSTFLYDDMIHEDLTSATPENI